MKLLSLLTFTALLSISACSHSHKHDGKACCAHDGKKEHKCEDGKCAKHDHDKKACCSGESCHKKS